MIASIKMNATCDCVRMANIAVTHTKTVQFCKEKNGLVRCKRVKERTLNKSLFYYVPE